jgi:hypothetical protein
MNGIETGHTESEWFKATLNRTHFIKAGYLNKSVNNILQVLLFTTTYSRFTVF